MKKLEEEILEEKEKRSFLKISELSKDSLKNKEKEKEWNEIRTSYGIYTEGKRGTYMIRPRFLEGKITTDKLEFLLKLALKYGDGRLHLTTRQDIQLHGVKRENIHKLLEKLSEKEYFTKATGGNSARAVIAPSSSGFEEEIFDVTPHNKIVTEHILSSDDYMGLPRKYKIAFANKEENSTYVKISDLGFLAVEKNGKKGFTVYGGGGLGPVSKEAMILRDFIKENEILYHVRAMRNLFSEHGNRKVKAKARIRYIVINLGEEEFLNLYNKYLDEVHENIGDEYKKITEKKLIEEREKIKKENAGKRLSNNEGMFKKKTDYNLIKGKYEAEYGYYIRPEKGDINQEIGKEIISFLKKLNYEIEMRLTSNQEIFVRKLIKEDALKLKKINRKFSKKEFFNSYSCIGKSVCNLGILDTPTILDEILKYFKNKQRLADYLPKLNFSGCPNSCAAHQIGKLGFQGKLKKDGIYFNIFARGEFRNRKIVKLNKNIGEIKSEQIPFFLEELATILKNGNISYEEYMKKNEFDDLIKKYGISFFKEG